MTILKGPYWLQEALKLAVEVGSRLVDVGATASSGFAANPIEAVANLSKAAAILY